MDHPNQNTDKHNQATEEHLITSDMLRAFYDRPSQLTDDKGSAIEAPHDGSLGLLALGHVGLIEWRKSRSKYVKEKNQENK